MRRLLFLIIPLISACNTVSVTPKPTAVYQQFAIGDIMRIQTQHGDKITLDFVEVTPKAIVGSTETIPFEEIAKIEKVNRW